MFCNMCIRSLALSASRCTARRPLRNAAIQNIYRLHIHAFHINVYIYLVTAGPFRFRHLRLIFIQSLNLTLTKTQLLVSCVMSPIIMTFYGNNGIPISCKSQARDRQTYRTDATLYRPIQVYFGC